MVKIKAFPNMAKKTLRITKETLGHGSGIITVTSR